MLTMTNDNDIASKFKVTIRIPFVFSQIIVIIIRIRPNSKDPLAFCYTPGMSTMTNSPIFLHSFTESYLSDTDHFVPSKIPRRLINIKRSKLHKYLWILLDIFAAQCQIM